MARLRRIAVLVVAAVGVALLGSSVQGLAAVDQQLATATKQERLERQQHRMLRVKQRQRPPCPPGQARTLTTREL
ncbi:MAG TPA: hypothetical protein VI111_10890 [Thermoleophilaceae bacterium]